MSLWKRLLKNGQSSWCYDFVYVHEGRRYRPVKVIGVMPEALAREMADAFRVQKLLEIHGLRPHPPPRVAPLALTTAIDVFLRDYRVGHRPGTVLRATDAMQALVRSCGPLPLGEVTLSHLEAAKSAERDRPLRGNFRGRTGLADATLAMYIAYWKIFFANAVDRGWLTQNPCVKVKRIQPDNARTRVLTDLERATLMAALPPAMQDVVCVLLNTGLRRGECLGLRWCEVDLAGATLRISARRRKQRTWHLVPLNREVMVLLRRLALRTPRPSPQGHVLVNPQGQPWNPKVFHVAWRRWTQRLGIVDLRPHDLRHTFASKVIEAGFGLETVQELLGHASIVDTRRYAHLRHAHLRGAVEALPTTWITTPDAPTAERP